MNSQSSTLITINDALILSYGLQWQPIPDRIKRALRIDKRLGICGGVFVTRKSAIGMISFIKRLNAIGEKVQ